MVTEIDNEIVGKNISDTLSLVGIVVIENGENKVIGRNHWVGQGLETIGSYLVGGASNGAASNIYIGSDTLIPTTVSMTGLATPIGSAPGTAPNTFNVSYSINLSSTVPATVLYTAVWNAGTVSGTLGEVGLYLKGYTGGLSGSTYATNPGLAARMAAADVVFTPFVINTSVALTVSWFVKFVYSSGTSGTQYITNPNLPSDPSQQPIVNITNSQSIPAPAGLQVIWQAPINLLQAYFNQYGINLNSDLSNMRILYNGQYVPAWIESINNGIATIWMKTPVSIPASSSIALSLNAGSSFNFDGVYWGEAPQLSPTYGQYDNGASVFNFYDNFAGTSLNTNNWKVTAGSGATITVNNGLTISTPANVNAMLGTVNSYPTSTIFEALWLSYSKAGGNPGSEFGVSLSNTSPNGSYGWFYNGAMYYYAISSSGSTTTSSQSVNLGSTLGVSWIATGNEKFYVNDNLQGTWSDTTATIGNSYYGFMSLGGGYTTTISFQYVRARAYPPNGVMPSISLL